MNFDRGRVERLGAFLLIVLLAVTGFWRLEQVTEKQCQVAAINRAALRLVVNDIADQAIGAVQSGGSSLERKEMLIARFEAYRTERLMALPEGNDCRHKTYAEIEAEVRQGTAAGAP